jgi:hypothetical protein
MKKSQKFLIAIPFVVIVLIFALILIILTAKQFGLIHLLGEDYDTPPPIGTLMSNDSRVVLNQANINWKVEYEKYIKKRVNNIEAFAHKQKIIELPAGGQIYFSYEADGEVLEKNVTIDLWHDGKKVSLPYEPGFHFIVPKTKGNFILEINLIAEQGAVQYITKVKIK